MAEKAPADTKKDLARRLNAEAVGTGLLLATVVGSGKRERPLHGGWVGWRVRCPGSASDQHA